MTAQDSTPGDRENVTDEQSGESMKPETPREAETTVSGVSGTVRAESDIRASDMRVLGTTGPDGEPSVSVSIQSEGLHDTSVVFSFGPETARELAQELEAQATHAEEWTAYKHDGAGRSDPGSDDVDRR